MIPNNHKLVYMKKQFTNLFRTFYKIKSKIFILLLFCISVVWTLDVFTEDIRFQSFSRSTYYTGRSPSYTVGQMAFSDINGDGRDEILGIEWPEVRPFNSFVSISRLEDSGRTILWRTSTPTYYRRFLVGNVDQNPHDELIAYNQGLFHDGSDTLTAFGWNGSDYHVIAGSSEISGILGAFLDIERDNIQELVLTSDRYDDSEKRDATWQEPSTLSVIKLSNGNFERIFSYSIPHGIVSLATGDLDGDGLSEIVTYEHSRSADISSQIAIHTVDPIEGIQRRIVIKNVAPLGADRRVDRFWYMDILECHNSSYLFVKTRGWYSFSIFRLEESKTDEWTLIPVRTNEFQLISEAIRASMAYSKEKGAYAIRKERHFFELISEQTLQTGDNEQICKSAAIHD